MTRSPKYWLKNLAYSAFWLMARSKHSNVRVSLLYHSVGSIHPRSVPIRDFERQVAYLKEHFRVVLLRDLPQVFAAVKQDEPVASITLDDGYLDNYQYALPVLENYGLKASFFIPTGFVGKTLQSSYATLPCMNATQLRELASLGHEIGAHSVTHPKLTEVPLEQAHKEIVESKRMLEDLLCEPVVSFAYPKGDYNEAVKRLVGEAGFRFAATVREGLIYNVDDTVVDWLEFPRVLLNSNVGWAQFRAKLSPPLPVYERLNRHYQHFR